MTVLIRPASRAIGMLIFLSLVGCGSPRKDNQLESLESSIKTFAKLMRWGEFESAADYLAMRDGKPIDVSFDRLRALRITRFELSNQTVAERGDEARANYRIEYYRDDSGIVRTAPYEQTWWYDAERKRWFTDTVFPAFE